MIATIVRIEGNVQVQRADGSVEALAVGDNLYEGDTVITGEGNSVVLEYPDNEQITVNEDVRLTITREQSSEDTLDDSEFVVTEGSAEDILNAIDDTDGDLLDQFEATAAGAGGGATGGDSGSSFVRLARILETAYDTPIGLTPVVIEGPEAAATGTEQPQDDGILSGTINLSIQYEQEGSGLTLSGTTTNLPPNSSISLVLTDSQGNQFTTTTTVNADGSYSVSGVDLTSLIDGNISVEASVVDGTGETITDNGDVVVDETQGDLTVEATTDGGILIVNGSSADLVEGAEVAIVITDSNGDTITVTAFVDANGDYSIDADVSGLIDGPLTIDASATDKGSTPFLRTV